MRYRLWRLIRNIIAHPLLELVPPLGRRLLVMTSTRLEHLVLRPTHAQLERYVAGNASTEEAQRIERAAGLYQDIQLELMFLRSPNAWLTFCSRHSLDVGRSDEEQRAAELRKVREWYHSLHTWAEAPEVQALLRIVSTTHLDADAIEQTIRLDRPKPVDRPGVFLWQRVANSPVIPVRTCYEREGEGRGGRLAIAGPVYAYDLTDRSRRRLGRVDELGGLWYEMPSPLIGRTQMQELAAAVLRAGMPELQRLLENSP